MEVRELEKQGCGLLRSHGGGKNSIMESLGDLDYLGQSEFIETNQVTHGKLIIKGKKR